MHRLLAVLLCIIAVDAEAADHRLRGFWNIEAPSDPGFSGQITIDAEGRAAFRGSSVTLGKSAQSRGYVSLLIDTKAEITLTDGKVAARVRCEIQSPNVMNCDDVGAEGRVSPLYTLRRVGPGPSSLLASQ